MKSAGEVEKAARVHRWRRAIGVVIARAIHDSDRNRDEVARAAGMSEAVLNDLVRGRRKTELCEIVRIAEAIDQNPLVLIRRMLLFCTGSTYRQPAPREMPQGSTSWDNADSTEAK